MFSIFQALFILFDEEKHSFMMNGNLVPGKLEREREKVSIKFFFKQFGCRRHSVYVCACVCACVGVCARRTSKERKSKIGHLLSPLFSTGIWLHFIIAITASATFGNSIRPDDERSVFN